MPRGNTVPNTIVGWTRLVNEISGFRKPVIIVGIFFLNQNMQQIMRECRMASPLHHESAGERNKSEVIDIVNKTG